MQQQQKRTAVILWPFCQTLSQYDLTQSVHQVKLNPVGWKVSDLCSNKQQQSQCYGGATTTITCLFHMIEMELNILKKTKHVHLMIRMQ